MIGVPTQGEKTKTDTRNGQQEQSQPDTITPISRHDYLIERGFHTDPFLFSRSEFEYSFAQSSSLDDAPYSALAGTATGARPTISPLKYFVDPPFPELAGQPTIPALRQPGHVVIFGAPGTGKTALRLALETDLRGLPDGNLVVTYQIGQEVKWQANHQQQLRHITRELAKDLFIQIVEQFDLTQEFAPQSRDENLVVLLRGAGPAVSRIIDRLLEDETPDSVWGLAELWRSLGRPVVRRVSRSTQLVAWLTHIQQCLADSPTNLENIWQADPEKLWAFARQTAQQWEFDRLTILVDGEHDVDSGALLFKRLRPLLKYLPTFTAQQCSLKVFLPPEAEKAVRGLLGNRHPAPLLLTLRWDEASLGRLLRQRFRAAGSRRLEFADLLAPDIRDAFDRQLLWYANGSPRRLLRLIDSLLNAHVVRDRQSDISADAWRIAQARTQ